MVNLTEKAESIKPRIEKRGAMAKDVNLDVKLLKPQMKLNLLDDIIKPHVNDFGEGGQRPRPIIIVPALHCPGNLSIGNAK